MPGSRRLGFGPVHLLLLLTVAELAVYRLAVPGLQVTVPAGQPIPPTPVWQAVLGWGGVFLHYFVGTLAIGLLIVRATRAGLGQGGSRGKEIAIASAAAVVGAVGALALVLGEDATTGFILETALFATMVIAVAVAAHRTPDDAGPGVRYYGIVGVISRAVTRLRIPGLMFGLGFVILPFAIHYYGVLAGKFWPDDAAELSGPTGGITRTGVSMLCLAAIASPYCFGPRPFIRSVTRIPPVVVAMVIAALSAVAARRYYPQAVDMVHTALGIQLSKDQPDPQVALYILAFATLCWTLASCAIADAEPRRRIGLGLGLIVLAGYHEVVWPAYFAVITVGLFTIVDAIPGLYEAERVDVPIAPTTPPIDDRVWQSWVTTLIGRLRGAGHHVHALTSRGDDHLMTTVVSGTVAARPFRMRVERIGGSVVVLDVRFGREVGDDVPPTFTIQARPEGLRDAHPEPPATSPRIELGDVGFDDRFKSRGDRAVLAEILDDGIRVRLTATMDGWLAVWTGTAVRHRIYPGRGAPVDHPVPLSDLALRRAGPDAADRLVTTISVLADVAARVVPAVPADPAASSDALPPAEPGEGG